MFSIDVRNVNYALPRALALLADYGQHVAPRGMATLEIPGPVATTYSHPRQMVLADPNRDANPFFHFFEALWILQGRGDVAFLAHFLPRMAEFSDDGVKFHAPYGFRLRHNFPYDQIEAVIAKLRADNDSRQAVMSIWDVERDLFGRSKDIPCNDMIMLKVRDGKLRMTVCNRSNDVIWGAYGANVVQFSTLLVYLAGRIGVEVGEYTQMSDSFHVYTDNEFWKFTRSSVLYTNVDGLLEQDDPYLHDWALEEDNPQFMHPEELASGDFDHDMQTFFNLWDNSTQPRRPRFQNYGTASFNKVVEPMYMAFNAWRAGERVGALAMIADVAAPDWRGSCEAWMLRRIARSAK